MNFSFPIAEVFGPGGSTLVETLLFHRLLHLSGPVPIGWIILYSILVIAVIFVGFTSAVAMLGIWGERKVSAHIQSRIGPNRVGPIGLLQSIADGVKLLLKEDLRPATADRVLFGLAPYLAFAPVFAAYLALPFGPEFTFEPRLSVGVFWILAILTLEVMGVILAGWASNNKWSIYGAMREACQMVSYEIPLGISILIGVMAAGTLNMVTLGLMQGGGLHTWLICRNPFALLAFFVYFIASLASNKRAPFDLPESESELVAGYHIEYSGLRFSFFFFAEYATMFVIGGIQAGLFLGSWNDPFGLIGYFHEKYLAAGALWPLFWVNCIAALIFISKGALIIFVQMWIRWTLPRPRIDQVLYACVKVLLPMAFALLLGAAVWGLLVSERAGIPWRDYDPIRLTDWRSTPYGSALTAFVVQTVLAIVVAGGAAAVAGWVAYAIVSGRGMRQRLTEPAPIMI